MVDQKRGVAVAFLAGGGTLRLLGRGESERGKLYR